ncbi:PP2C family protein-serine/threonine phosphatase [Salmonirosea aquatica]|uniref:Serine/threonine-protein phosphatase n=1 Tax=Salmonirosea aquatica TaxID=2654236 RepID=A0A7C9BF23_9BACT|nr:serine/threonine-protein phosphatase [Cytophagaceae bacterium SJW1-29]
MSITIYQPVCFNETGNRTHNEDSVFPPPGHATVADRLFLVCDGVGGEHRGEVASAEACRCLSEYFAQNPDALASTDQVQQALEYTRGVFESIEKQDPDSAGMATTLTLLLLLDNKVAMAHLGDSRIYQVREGRIIYQTRDHKWVNELIASGVITEEQAREHPKKNVITRVLSASRPDQADFKIIDDVRAGDYFFLCTDGVLERVYDGLLEYHLGQVSSESASTESIMASLREECEGMTNDNFSAYLIQIESVGTEESLVAILDKEITAQPDRSAPPPVHIWESRPM